MSSSVFAGLATGIGSWPGTDVREAAGIVLGELPALPHVVELPARGLGADLIGRTGALMVDVELDVRTSGYRIAQRATRAGRHAEDLLSRDLDILEELWETGGFAASLPVLKAQVAGPFTMAAEVELRNAHRVLTDRGAVRHVAESLAEGIREHVAELRRRLGVDVVVQLDEPSLPAVLRGSLPGVSRLDPVPAFPEPDALELLDSVLGSLGVPAMVHCCAAGAPIDLIRRSAADAVALDASLLRSSDLDAVGELLQAGKTLVLGVVPGTTPERTPTWREAAAPAVTLVDRLGFPRSTLASQVSVTPACGLASATPEWARTALTLVENVADAFGDAPDSL